MLVLVHQVTQRETSGHQLLIWTLAASHVLQTFFSHLITTHSSVDRVHKRTYSTYLLLFFQGGLEQSCCIILQPCCSLPYCSGVIYFFAGICGWRVLSCSKSDYVVFFLIPENSCSTHWLLMQTGNSGTNSICSLFAVALVKHPSQSNILHHQNHQFINTSSSVGILGCFNQGIFTCNLLSELCLMLSGVGSNNFQKSLAVCGWYAIPIPWQSDRPLHCVSMRARRSTITLILCSKIKLDKLLQPRHLLDIKSIYCVKNILHIDFGRFNICLTYINTCT